MAKWKISRLIFGKEEFTFSEGDEVTIGRGLNNKIVLSSLLISRHHCVLNAKKDEVYLTDLKSANGIYVGSTKIPSYKPVKLKALDVIGFGLTTSSVLPNVEDKEKYLFKVTKEETTLADRIVFQNEDEIEEELLALEKDLSNEGGVSLSPILDLKPNLKRKIDQEKENVVLKNYFRDHQSDINSICGNKVNIKNDLQHTDKKPAAIKKIKVKDVRNEDIISSEEFNKEENDLELEVFTIKREYLGHDDDPIQIDSDSDDSESEQWFLRLSQNSPGKPFTHASSIKKHVESVKDFQKDESSYSQMDDEIENNLIHIPEDDEDYMTDLISIPPPPPDYEIENNHGLENENKCEVNEIDNFLPTEHTAQEPSLKNTDVTTDPVPIQEDVVDGYTTAIPAKSAQNKESIQNIHHVTETNNKIQLILPQPLAQRRISKIVSPERKVKTPSRRNKKSSSSKRTITESQKEERKRKLKAIAEKNRDHSEQSNVVATGDDNKKALNTINVKVTSTNRTMKMTKDPHKQDGDYKSKTEAPIKIQALDKKSETTNEKSTYSKSKKEIETKKELDVKVRHPDIKSTKLIEHEETLHKHKQNLKHKSKYTSSKDKPVKSLKPLTESEESLSGKPLSKVEPLPQRKPKKSVRFSEAAPQVREFEIEPGNRMRKTSLIKTTLVDVQQMPIFSLEKISLMKVLRWNPNWLVEQTTRNIPPPILGHTIEPTPLYHTFENHNQYVQQVGDLLLMEIWDSISLAYMKACQNQQTSLSMRIASLPPVPPPERYFDIFNVSVDISLPNTELKNLPKVGDVLLVSFGSENTRRFFFLHNIRCLPSPARNIHSFYNLSLHATFTQKMRDLKPGEVISGLNLGHINNEMNLFEAMGYLASSPLSEAILRPEPRHFVPDESFSKEIRSPWTMTLNESQMRAVTSSVAAALGDRPCIQMIQGPPGTGKSSVICSIVMTYFYDKHGNRHQNRGKILICATSNAAVDGLVLKLLKIRQNLPKPQRFRMVRVGRLEAMHERARDLSSQQLAARDAQRPPAPAPHNSAVEEISLLNAKINKWKSAAIEAKDPVRVAYCEGRVKELEKRKGLLSGGAGAAGEALRPEQLQWAERRIVECADIIATTLASVHNHKLRGVKRRIALCIVDEAGQAIEPEALLPLTLDVTKLTLVGDPQQLPGYICSQRAKRLGLGDSLFARLSSCAETWNRSDEERAIQLLQVQYRMHAHIADYPNRAFYASRVGDQPPTRPALPCMPYAVIGISSGDKGQAVRGENEMEAWGVSRVAAALSAALRRAALPPGVAVITPYQAQRDTIRRKLWQLQDSAKDNASSVEVNTVDSFQGQERDVVIVSLARSHGLGFVADAGRMNVLLTRARHALIVCLNPRAVQNNPQWRTLLEDAQRRNLYRVLPNSMCQPAGPITDDAILSYISNNHTDYRSHR
ncbi:uncharacterized protein Setx [Plodia interpunctella]|uniref:uncharacterized protein Setx n=1 Tax=Plodia interpunctella TaxID=58824 RepID=UPI0023689865|nr:uncharacterized protein LOC128672984 [Plodia interpunctella]